MDSFVTIVLDYLYNFSFLDDIDALYLKQGRHFCSSK